MELADLLREWDLERLVDKCEELGLDVETLLEITNDTVDRITLNFGDQLRLLKRIRQFKLEDSRNAQSPVTASVTNTSAVIATSAVTTISSVTTTSSAVGTSSLVGTSSVAGPSTLTGPSTSTSTGPEKPGSKRRRGATAPPPSLAAKKLSCLSEAARYEALDLKDLLLNHHIGKHVLLAYEQSGDDGEVKPTLHQEHRKHITKIIIDFVFSVTDEPSHSLFTILAEKIVKLFPNESTDDWYRGPDKVLKRYHPTGKLADKLRNEKGKRNTLAKVAQQSHPACSDTSLQSSSIADVLNQPVTDEVNGAVAWIRHGRSPWPKVLQQWTAAAPFRLKQIFMGDEKFINVYLQEWKVLEHKSGYELILSDFKLLYDCADNLYNNWENFCKTTITLIRNDVKDKVTAKVFSTFDASLSQDNQASILLYCLPALRPNHTITHNGTKVRIPIAVARDSYLVYVPVIGDIKKAIASRREVLKNQDGGGQPLIVLIGPSENAVQQAYVSVADLLYRVDGVVAALDLFFKSFHALHIAYPPESNHIWVVLQRAVYKFKTEWDKSCFIHHNWVNAYK